MKFNYEEKQDRESCVAMISDMGNLVLKNTETGVFSIAICITGSIHNGACLDESDATHKFYKGDKVEITF